MSLEGAAASIASTVISLAFTAVVFRQWLAHRKPYQLAWSLGLAMFTVAALMQFLSEAYGWTEGVYRAYYFVAAPLVAVLGVGSAFLANRRLGLVFSAYTGILTLAFAWIVFTAPVNGTALQQSFPAGQGFSDSVRIWSPLFTIPGSLALIVIALYSYVRSRLVFNLWIAAGAIVAAGSGSLAVFGVTWALYLGELLGIALMFWGFLESRDVAKAPGPVQEKVSAS